MLLRVRDDDVLLPSRAWGDPFLRFKELHEWILLTDCVVHVPAICVNEIQDFPQCIAYIKEQTQDGRMLPEVHGMEHIDYGALAKDDVRERLCRARDWIAETFDHVPTVYYSQWGATQPHLHEAAAEANLRLVDTQGAYTLEGPTGAVAQLKGGMSIKELDGREILMHWWTRGPRLLRVCKSIKYGSYAAAMQADPKLFR